MKIPRYVWLSFLLGTLPVSAEEVASSATPPDTSSQTEPEDPEQQFQAARALLHGDGVPRNVKKSFELMKLAADQGHPEASGGLGYFYSNGIAVPRDEKQALAWFRKGAEKGSAKARLNLGKFLVEGKGGGGDGDPAKDRQEGLDWIQKAADQGLPEAAMTYGSICYFGQYDTPRDYEKAFPYLKISAVAGSAEAQNFVGNMLELGMGTAPDESSAREWFRKAALQGNVKAQANLGRILGPESADTATRVEALAWLLLSSSQGEVTAEKSLEGILPTVNDADRDAVKIRIAELRKLIVHKYTVQKRDFPKPLF